MKQFLSLLLMAAFLVYGCKENEPQVKEMSTTVEPAVTKTERNKSTVAGLLENLNKHDLDAAFQNATPDFKDYGDGSAPPVSLDSMKASIRSWLVGFPDYKGSEFTYAAEDDLVMVWSRWSGTWKGEMMGQKPSGKQFSAYDVDIFRFNDEGKITEHHNVVSLADVMKQVGMKME